MEKEKTNKKKKLVLGALAVLLLGGGIFGYKMYQNYQMQQLIDGGMASPEPTLPAIDQKTFEELPVGVIYEVPKELQEQYIEAAKAKYEKYGHLGPQQKSFFGNANMHDQLKAREDITPRDNNEPSDMLNDDMSLRYPDMFYGFIIHDDNLEGVNVDSLANKRYDGYREYNSVARAMNSILYIEDYYTNNGKIGNMSKSLESEYLAELSLSQLPRHASLQMMKEAMKSGLIESSKNADMIYLLFKYMAYHTTIGLNGINVYGSAHSMMAVDNIDYFHEADGITVDDALKYDVSKECTEAMPVFYYPVRVWKVDNNSIVVDIQMENGGHLQTADVLEIYVKLSQSNLSDESKEYKTGDIIEYSSDKYVVYGRLFNSDITQGVLSEYGSFPINYKSLGVQSLDYTTCHGLTYVPNEKAENLLRDFYTEVKEQLEVKKSPSTKEILRSVAKKNGIPYNDALAIYGTYYLQATTMISIPQINW